MPSKPGKVLESLARAWAEADFLAATAAGCRRPTTLNDALAVMRTWSAARGRSHREMPSAE